jgi:hypothetical protein
MKPLPTNPMERVALGIATLCDGISEGNWERLEALRAVVAMPAARAGRVSPRAGSRLGHTATIPIANDNEGRP